MGGIDNYLLWTSPKKIDSEKGMELRAKIIAEWEKKHGR